MNYLIHEIPTGSNVWHFRHSLDKFDGLCRPCCAVGLLRLPVFTTQGGSGKSPGINAKPPVYVIPLGLSLAETLRLSWRSWPQESNLGTPAWEKPNLQLPKTGDVPMLAGLTWLPRRVWLDDPKGREAKCIYCAREELLIRRCIFAGIGTTKSDAQGRVWHDPHVIRHRKGMVMTPSNALDACDAAAGEWAKITHAILNGEQGAERRKVWVVSFASRQNKYFEAKEFEIPLISATDHQKLRHTITEIETWQNEAERLSKKIQKILRSPEETRQKPSPPREHTEARPMVAALRPHVEAKVSAKLDGLLAGGEHDWEQAANEYQPIMGAVARSLSPGYTSAAVERRRQVASLKPNMRPIAKASKRPGPKKGGDK